MCQCWVLGLVQGYPQEGRQGCRKSSRTNHHIATAFTTGITTASATATAIASATATAAATASASADASATATARATASTATTSSTTIPTLASIEFIMVGTNEAESKADAARPSREELGRKDNTKVRVSCAYAPRKSRVSGTPSG